MKKINFCFLLLGIIIGMFIGKSLTKTEVTMFAEQSVKRLIEVKIQDNWIPYKVCSNNKDAYPEMDKIYLGESDTYRIDGIISSSDIILHYWK